MDKTTSLLGLLAVLSCSSALLTSPPRIVKQPTVEELLFQVAQPSETDKPFMIECEAEGEPAPKYRWVKNGKPFEFSSYSDRISQQLGRGTLVINKPRDEDIGQYQCFATNEWGTATSNSVFVRKAELNNFKDEVQQEVTADEGPPFKMSCQPPDGWPKPSVFWMLQGDQGQLKTINNSRMTLDPEGNLWFSNVTRRDASVDFAYVCAARSSVKNEYKFGNKLFLKVRSTGISPGLNKHEPVRQYTSRRNEVGLKGKRIKLYCIYGGTPLPQTIWMKDGAPIPSSSEVSQDDYGKSLVIGRARSEDQGTYTCEVSNGVGTPKSYSIKLEIKAAPYFTEEPQNEDKAPGETAIIRCKAEGNPEPQIKWIHNGKPIEQAEYNPRRRVGPDFIEITDLVRKDTGNYGCNATNSIGHVYKDVYINVQEVPPEIKDAPEDLILVDGSEALMKCRVTGAPRPIVKWIRDGTELTGGRFNITEKGDLWIRDVSFTDVGKYECFAKNNFGNASAYGSLTVKKRTVITDKPENYEVRAGSSATFRCNAHADDSLNLEIIWLNDGQAIDFDNQPRYHMTNDYSLLISDTSELDSGDYTCIARTEIDETSAQATLTVQDRPNPPELTGIECRERVATLRWAPKGDNRAPILKFSIQYNTSFTPDTWDLASDNVPNVDTTWVVDLSPWANYTFRVTAWNKIGASLPSGHSAVCSTQPDVPFKNPDNVEGRGTDPSNMVISWSPMPQIEHNGPGFYYLVSWRRNISGQPWTDEQVRDWRTSEYVVQNTPTFQPYKIKVIAVNSKGTSNVAPVEVTGWSGEDVPLEAPSNVTIVEVVSGTSALLTWNPVSPESLRGHFVGYKIQTWADDENERREYTVQSDTTKTLVSTLVPFTKNNVWVMAYNSRFNGPPSERISFDTPEGKPSTVRSFEAHPLGSSAMLLKWQKPQRDNGILIGYKIYYQNMTGTALGPLQERKKDIDAKFDRAKLAGLKPNTKYRISITAKTRAGESEPVFVEKTTKSATTGKPDVPEFDVSLLPGRPGAAHALVRWIPATDGHPGTHFTASYRLQGHPLWQESSKVTDDDYTVLTGLEPGQVYEVKITAFDGEYMCDSIVRKLDTTIDELAWLYNSNYGPVITAENTMATAGWFIGVMVALAFLVLVLIAVCVARRNRGGKYDVHDRELQHGRADYPEHGFHEYTHPLDNKSRHSTGSGKHPESDTDSMAEYGEGETAGMNEDGSFIGRFTEDGSFIGQYVPGARVLPPAPPAPAPPVYV